MTKKDRVEIANSSIQHLTNAILTNGVTKKKIEGLAKSLASLSKNPDNAWVMLNVIEKLVDATKSELKDKALEKIKNTPESQRNTGNIKYDIQTRTTIIYSDSTVCKNLEAKLKAEKSIVKKQVDEVVRHLEDTGEVLHSPVTFSRSEYLKVTLPKD